MSTVLAKWMTIFLSLTIIFTPLFVYIDSLHREVVDMVLQKGMKEASVQGYLSPTISNKMKDTLVNDFKFDRNEIVITSPQTTPQNRGGSIEVQIKVPRGPLFILNLFNQGPSHITRKATIMSEYIL